jgi:hypothetical protein
MPVNSIGFSIPESKIIEALPRKTKQFAHIVPGDLSTYIFHDEESYYKDYQTSVFGRTCKKEGWDCMRHYEILANGCIPWFTDIDKCPPQTMTHFPKEIVLEAMSSDTPEAYIPRLMEYTRRHLTCRAMAQYVFDKVGCPNPNRVLFLGSNPHPDYLRCLTLIGMKQLLGNHCVESVFVPHIYEDYPTPERLYGRGFTYTRILPTFMKPSPVHIDEIRNHSFDLVVYGSLHRGLPYWEEVNNVYKPHEIIMLCGEDCDSGLQYHNCNSFEFGNKGYNVFIRELSFEQ